MLATPLELPVGLPVAEAGADVDVTLLVVDAPPDDLDLSTDEPLYLEPPPRPDRPSDFAFHQVGSWSAIRVVGGVDYYLDETRILAHLHDARALDLIGLHLCGMVMALWLERRGVVCLHGSAVDLGGGAAVFLATKGAGKTTTAAYLAANGHALLTDDLVALHVEDGVVHVRPAYPEIRLWPEQLAHLVPAGGRFPRVRPDAAKVRVPVGPGGVGRMADGPVPVRRLFVPARGTAATVRVEPVAPSAALVELVRHSYLPNEVGRLGLQSARLPFLAGLLAQAPLATLRFPEGMDRLAELHEAVLADA